MCGIDAFVNGYDVLITIFDHTQTTGAVRVGFDNILSALSVLCDATSASDLTAMISGTADVTIKRNSLCRIQTDASLLPNEIYLPATYTVAPFAMHVVKNHPNNICVKLHVYNPAGDEIMYAAAILCTVGSGAYGHWKHVLAAVEAVIGAVSCSAMSGSRRVGFAEMGRICASSAGSS
eukprot:SAG22_NODE_1852_length_3441_cov_3.839019_2_plen_178_part_00